MSNAKHHKPAGKHEADLDRSLEETFPASDAPAIVQPKAGKVTKRVDRKPPLVDRELAERMAERLRRKER